MTDSPKARIGILGCGFISHRYLTNLATLPDVEVVALADLVAERAGSRAAEFGIPRACAPDELFADSSIEFVLNLTNPAAHADSTLAALRAGKHVYSEKPIATTFAAGTAIVAEAESRGLRLGCAPDTVLGDGIQACRRLVAESAIGTPVAASAAWVCPGHEIWHPDPEFYFREGGGPLYDMGPYVVTALVTVLGSVSSVIALTTRGAAERKIHTGPRAGTRFPVEVPTHYAALLQFESGAVGTLVTSFDTPGSDAPFLEFHGTVASVSGPDPDTFGGPVRIRTTTDDAWTDIPLSGHFVENSRGIGLVEMVRAQRADRDPICSGRMALHVLEVMEAIHRSSGERLSMTTRAPATSAFEGL